MEYIKVPHHGSKNGLNQGLLDAVKPELAVISVGENNRFGHPSSEVLNMLKEAKVEVLRTDEQGDVEVITNGVGWWVSN